MRTKSVRCVRKEKQSIPCCCHNVRPDWLDQLVRKKLVELGLYKRGGWQILARNSHRNPHSARASTTGLSTPRTGPIVILCPPWLCALLGSIHTSTGKLLIRHRWTR